MGPVAREQERSLMLSIQFGKHHVMHWWKVAWFKYAKYSDYRIWQLTFFDVVMIHLAIERSYDENL